MSECYCDFEEGPEIYRADRIIARITHRCDECHTLILPGDRYENVAGKWEGRFETFKTCAHCLSVRDAMWSRLPCFCFSHGGLSESVQEWLDNRAEMEEKAPGLAFHILFTLWERRELLRTTENPTCLKL